MLLVIIVIPGALLFACSNPQASEIYTEPNSSSNAGGIRVPEIVSDNRVEVVYFHTPWRCATCLCFEKRITLVVNTEFSNDLTSGKLTFTICDISDRSKAPLIRKYDASASQLFVNTIVNNTENIVNIEEIWNWHCQRDKQGFDAQVRAIIEKALIQIRG
jgi:hypothetical protein